MSEAKRRRSGAPYPVIAGYELQGILGRGTTGVVYRARQLSVDREVALKVMHPELVRSARSIKRLKREARTAALLTHPNLVTSIDMGETAGTWWFAMELVHGEALSSRLERGGRLSENEALPIFIRLCDALEHASQKGVVHRDIKPANILLEEGDNPRLVDLGLARVVDDPMITRTGATLGTPHYISPEQARDPGLADVRSDLWSLGATMFHVLCGQPPFTGSAAAEILSGVLYGAIPNPAELRPELSRGIVLVLRKCLSREPTKRYHTPAELLEDLRLVQSHKPPAIKPSTLEPLDPARSRERRQSALSILGVGAAVVMALVVLVWQPWNGEPGLKPEARVAEPAEWAPIVRLRRDVTEGRLLVRDAWIELESLRAEMPKRAMPQWMQLKDFLLGQLEQLEFHFYRGADEEIARLMGQRDFEALRNYLDPGLDMELAMLTGFSGMSLPRERDRAKFERYVGSHREDLERQRRAALETAARRISKWAQDVFLPGLTRKQGQGRWNEVRELLGREDLEHYRASGADLRGVETAELRTLLQGLSLELTRRQGALDADWFKLDSRVLRRALVGLGDEFEVKLKARELLRASEEYGASFEALLAEHQLTRETLEDAPEHHSLDYFLERKLALLELEEMLLERDALARIAELDQQAEPLFSSRRYAEALEFWESHLDDSLLQPARNTAAIRIEEAQELLAFLQRAARGVRSFEGREVLLKQGSIAVSGEVELRGDPLQRGFRVMISSSSSKDYLLRETPGVRGEVLELSAFEQFALEGADVQRDLGLLKQRAIFHYREGDFEGASKLLHSELLEVGELLLYDLGLRVDTKLGREQDVLAARREHALAELTQLTRPEPPQGDKQRLVVRIGRLLREYGDVLDPSEEARLRSKRERLQQRPRPSRREDFDEVFGPDEVRFWSLDKVSMSFEFGDGEAGAWRRGDWVVTGTDSWRSTPLSSLGELERSSVPTLMLRDPLLVDEGTLTLTVRMRQPQDSPPELFVISALGFHMACVGPLAGRQPSLLVDTSNLTDVAKRAREGKGYEFRGLTAGEEHTITMRLTRASGKVVVTIDGVRVLTANRVAPRAQARSSSISFRSFEPLEVLGVSVEGTRR